MPLRLSHIRSNNATAPGPARGARRDDAKHSVRQRIVAAARRRFLAQGFRGVTMSELAHELGMSKKTVYTHFSGKQVLVEAILIDKFQEAEADLKQLVTARQPEFLTMMRQLLACLRRHTAEIGPPFLRDLERELPELFQIVETRRREIVQRHFGRLLKQGRRQGLIRTDISVSLILEILLGATDAVINPPKLNQLGITPNTGFSAIVSVVLEGAMTHKTGTKR